MLDQLCQVLLADSVLGLDVQQDDPSTNFDLKKKLKDFNVVEDDHYDD